MKKMLLKILFSGFASIFLLASSIASVEAARLGGGKTMGRTPSAPIQKQAQPAPAQNTAPQTKPATPATQAPAPAKQGFGMGGMLGGIAAGLGIGYLLSHFGMGEAAASFATGLLFALLAAVVLMFIVRKFMPTTAKSSQAHIPKDSRTEMPLQKSNLDFSNARQEPNYTPVGGTNTQFANQFGTPAADPVIVEQRLPEGFDQIAFLSNAKHYFTRLQKAWDIGDLDALREFTTPEMFVTLQQDLQGRSEVSNQTDVVTLNAELLGVETSASTYLCSVQFSGMIRERSDQPAEPFTEIWNLTKPVEGQGGWVLAGIQQLV